jgi:hypothetical protein
MTKEIEFPEDIKRLRTIPILWQFSDWIVQILYHSFSSEEYCAGWMYLSEERIKEFEKWLKNE